MLSPPASGSVPFSERAGGPAVSIIPLSFKEEYERSVSVDGGILAWRLSPDQGTIVFAVQQSDLLFLGE